MRYAYLPLDTPWSQSQTAGDGKQPGLRAWLLDASPEMPALRVRPAVIICPGGGYCMRSDREAEPIAMRLLAQGIHAFVLEYSVAPTRYPTAVLELAASVRLLRQNAEAFGIQPDQIFIMGFSAGGHLCATLGTLWDTPVFAQALKQGAGKDWRPDGMLLCYPVITMGAYTHQGSRENLLGADAPAARCDALSLENAVSGSTVPAFLWHTFEDDAVPVENTLLFATALRKAAVPFELHVYEKGGHGLSLCDATTAQGSEHLMPDNANWMAMAIAWINRHREAR